ncbi:MAG: Gfo/Idh/MocA family oxidoreductase [Verrucomicrobiota bacterium]|nr:Gfo/Idh/MocA family oxidoreductase [Verrucomicrobiota bacterium]
MKKETFTPAFSRRSFLKSTGTLVAAAPFLLPSRVWSAEVNPNDKVTLGFIGIGTQARGLMSGFLGNPRTQVVAVCDVDTTRRENGKKMAEEFYGNKKQADYKGCAAYNDFRELIGRKDIDAVVIATPDHWHALIAMHAAAAGKDIYCEKPLTQSIHEARALVNSVRKHGRVFQTGSQQRSSAEFLTACELVQNGAIGKIHRVEVAIGGPGVPCDLPGEASEPGLDWEMWLGPAPSRPYHSELSPRGVHKHFPNWRKYNEYGGGMVTDWGAHHFDIAQWGLGMDESGPVEVFPAAAPNATHGVRLVYANGTEVIHTEGNGVWFHGKEGKIHVNRGKFEFWKGEKQLAPSTKEMGGVASDYLSNAKTKLYKSTDHKGDWLDCIASRKRPICDVEIGARSVTVCHLVNLAYRHRQKLDWDPKANQFKSGTGKAEWLDISHRAPWSLPA